MFIISYFNGYRCDEIILECINSILGDEIDFRGIFCLI